MKGAGENEAMTDIFSRWTIISRSEGVEGITDAVDVIEKFADLAPPGSGAGERVVGDEIQAPRHVTLKMQRQGVVTGTIVGAKYGDSWKIIAPVAVHASLQGVVRAQNPVGVEGVLNAGGGMQCIRRVVIRIDQRREGGSFLDIEIVDGGEGFDPAVLCEVVEKKTDPSAQDGVAG